MILPIRSTALAAVTVASLSLLSYPAPALSADLSDTQKCSGISFSRASYHTAAKTAFRDSRLTVRERRRLRLVFSCQAAPAKSKPILRMHAHRYKRAWRIRVRWDYYKAHPMPTCTWKGESGSIAESGPEWPPSRERYTKPNATGSAASGKFQIMDGTWTGYGGTWRGWHSAAASPPLEQEKVARRVYAGQGIGAWAAC